MSECEHRFWRIVEERIAWARSCGSLCPLTTEMVPLDSEGVRFPIHVLGRGHRKLESLDDQHRTRSNPFLEPEPDLLLGPVSPTHQLVLNKFPVLDLHLLIVTRVFEAQSETLTHDDLEALSLCLNQVDGLGFFNSSRTAGASQDHKHLQLVSLPIGFGPGKTPVEHLIEACPPGHSGPVPGLSFSHVLRRPRASEAWLDPRFLWHQLEALRVACCVTQPGQPYNLLLTRRWMMLVPRVRECFEGLSVNALGFVGSLLVRDRVQLERVREIGPQQVLASVTGNVRGLDG